MYIQITTRCNMSCAHYCYNCTKEGSDMSLATYRAALKLCEEWGDTPFIGGGEPTLHPKFTEFLCEAMGACETDMVPGLVTNGSIKQRAMLIHKLTAAGVVDGTLSLDEFHDPIDPEVVKAFKTLKANGRNYAIRDNTQGGTREVLPQGRAIEHLGLDGEDDDETIQSIMEGECLCDSLMVKPNGDIHQCGCDDSPKVGTTRKGFHTPSTNMCYRSQDFRGNTATL